MQKPRKTTLKDLSDELGVSITTIARVLSGRAEEVEKFKISKSTQERVIAAAKQKNFSFNRLARALRVKETFTVGLVVPDISNPFFATFARHVEFATRKMGYAVILCDSGGDIAVEVESVELLASRQVSGLIVSPVGLEHAHLEKLYDANIPLVLIDRYFPELEISYVGTDNYRATYQATKYMIDCGHRRIACVQGLCDIHIGKERLRGYTDALTKYGIPIDNDLIAGDSFSVQNGYLSTKLLMEQPYPPTAILGLSNQISLGCLYAIKEEGLSVPEDISLIAFDEQPYSTLLSLTTIKQQTIEIGQIAIKLLMAQIGGGDLKRQRRILLPPSLIIRDSVKIQR